MLDTATPRRIYSEWAGSGLKTYPFRIRKRGPFGFEQLQFGELGQGRIVGRWQNLVMALHGLQPQRERRSGELAQDRFVGRSHNLVAAARIGTPTSAPRHPAAERIRRKAALRVQQWPPRGTPARLALRH